MTPGNRVISSETIKKIQDLYGQHKYTYNEIAKLAGSKVHLVSYYAKRRETLAGQAKNKTGSKQKVKLEPAITLAPVQQKPMIALVGSPEEITKTIKELFS